MTLDYTCNRLTEAERKAALWDGIVRCGECRFFDTRKCKSQWPFSLDGHCAWGERRRDA